MTYQNVQMVCSGQKFKVITFSLNFVKDLFYVHYDINTLFFGHEVLLHRVLLIYSILIDARSRFNTTMLKFYYFGKKSHRKSCNFTLQDTAQVSKHKQFKVYQKVLTIFIQLCEKYLKIKPLKQRFYLISYPYTAISIGILH